MLSSVQLLWSWNHSYNHYHMRKANVDYMCCAYGGNGVVILGLYIHIYIYIYIFNDIRLYVSICIDTYIWFLHIIMWFDMLDQKSEDNGVGWYIYRWGFFGSLWVGGWWSRASTAQLMTVASCIGDAESEWRICLAWVDTAGHKTHMKWI